MNNRRITVVLCLMAALHLATAGSNHLLSSKQPASRACPCPKIYRPVCAADGRAYSNKCLAQCAGVMITDHNPRNPQACNKIAILPPGPTTSRPTGSNSSSKNSNGRASGSGRRLLASLSQQQQAGPGGACPCPRIYAPVCGSDGTAYNNKCEAGCKGVSITQQRPLNGQCDTASAAAGPSVTTTPSTTNGAASNPSGPAAVSRPWLQQGGSTGAPVGPSTTNSAVSNPSGPAAVSRPWLQPGGSAGAPVGPSTTNSAVSNPSGPTAVSRPWLQPGGSAGAPVGPVCACPLILAPVCDSNGKTHANECVARCNGVSVVAKGSCN